MNSHLFQPPCILVLVIADEFSVVPTSMFFVFVIADEFSVVPTSIFSCICYCRWILSCSNLHVFLYLLLQMNSQLFQPPCFLYLLLQINSQLFQPPSFIVFVIADEFSVVPPPCFLVFVITDELSCSKLHVFLYLLLQMNSQLFQPPCFLYLLLQMNYQLFQPPCTLVFVTADEFSVVPTSMFSCICYCRWILSCSNLHVSLYLLLQMNSQLFQPSCFLVFVIAGDSQLFQPPCFPVFVIADEFLVVPTPMFSCICYCRWILSCSNLHVFLYLLLQMNSQLFQPPCFLVFVIAGEFSVVPTSMFSSICYCRWILSCSNPHVFLYLLLKVNYQLSQPPCFLLCFLLLVITDELSFVPTSMYSCISYCRWILSCSNLHVFCICYCRWILSCSNLHVFCICYCRWILQPPCFLYLLLQMNYQLFQPPCFACICYCRWILSCSNLHVFLYLLLQMNSQLFQPPCFLVFVIADEFSVVPTIMFSCICYCRWILSCSNLHVSQYLLLQMNS